MMTQGAMVFPVVNLAAQDARIAARSSYGEKENTPRYGTVVAHVRVGPRRPGRHLRWMRPPGTLKPYLSCAEMAAPPNTTSATAAVEMVNILLRFIAGVSFVKVGVITFISGSLLEIPGRRLRRWPREILAIPYLRDVDVLDV